MNANIKTGQVLEMTTLPQMAREVGMSARGLGLALERNGIVGDAVLVEGRTRSALYLRARMPLIEKIVNAKEK